MLKGVFKLGVVAALAGIVLVVVLHPLGFAFAIGIHPVPDGTPWTYQLLSGFVPALVVLQLAVMTASWYYQHTCHALPWCLRWGKYEAAGGIFKVCRHHHPRLRGARPHRDLIHSLHSEWERRG